ncbi:sulfatase-like hydrolase/transferase [Stieleria sp. TO1_6]|uniref:sulfatase-like hydrolase/transferase n=1 Tax=Stieleria tagensis TaxID=2956795 RepID=UPI00209B7C8B|nr:sulfatase-like hydrolase/transferase [Stieleria tagensis]MCO8121272.1 sulfatase-like hydrolase/transferase [Stieleria tagensis]
MLHSRFSRLALLTLAALWCGNDCQTRADRPNILWIYVDDMSDWLGCYGDPIAQTPNIDSLAQTGVVFENAFMPAPVCSTTRSALITGTMQTTLGLHQHRTMIKKPLPDGVLTVPELFRRAGYLTFNEAKDDYNFQRERDLMYSPEFNRPDRKQVNSHMIGRDVSWLKQLQGKPFFGQIQLKGGKTGGETGSKYPAPSRVREDQVNVPPQYPDHPVFRNAIARHYEQIAETDAQVGAIIAGLKAYDLWDNTAVFFFTDHGSPLPRAKQFLYEDGTKVPLIVHWPSSPDLGRPRGETRSDLVSGIDITASSLGLAGIGIPEFMEGRDLFADDYRPRTYVISARDRMGNAIDRIRTVRSKESRYIRNYKTDRALYQPQYRENYASFTTLRQLLGAGKLSELQASYHDAENRPSEEFYDLTNDPHQTVNLVNDPNFANVIQAHRRHLDQWEDATDDQGRYPESQASLKLVFETAKGKCVSPEYDFLKVKRPNVVFFLVDDLGSGELVCYASKFHETPNIDALAARGMRFTHAYSAATLCSPSRAALLTGRSPARLHLTDWIPGQQQINRKTLTPDWQTYIDRERVLLPEAMKEQGYATAFIGKWHLIPRPKPTEVDNADKVQELAALYQDHLPTNNGFDENFGGDHSPNQGHRFFYPAYHRFPGLKGKGSKDECLTDVLTDCAVDFLRRKQHQPFFLYFSYYTVHTPITGKPGYVEKYKQKLAENPNADYYMKDPGKAAMIQSLDESVGRVIETLKSIDQLDNTLIIFTGDNGSQGDEFVPNFRGNKGTAYEGGTRVPLIVAGPHIRSGVSDVPTIGMDLYPTILSYLIAPLKPDEHLDGIDIGPVLTGSGTVANRPFYWHYPHYDETTPYSSAIVDGWKIIRYADDGNVELYDLNHDPTEQHDVAADYPEKATAIEKSLDKYLAETDAQFALPNPDFDPNQFSGGIREYNALRSK